MRRATHAIWISTILIAAGFLQSCGKSEESREALAADEAAVRATSKAWSDSAQSKDLDKAVSFYTADAVALPDAAPVARNISELRAEWSHVFGLDGPGLSWRTTAVDIAKAGDMATEYGAYQFVMTDKSGKPQTISGKYLLVWKKQTDGTWKVFRDTDNHDAPPPAPAPVAPPAPSAHTKSKSRSHHHSHAQ